LIKNSKNSKIIEKIYIFIKEVSMNTKNVILVTAITALFGNNIINAQELTDHQQKDREYEEFILRLPEQQRRRLAGLPADPTKTPTSADVIDADRALERKGIYYGKDSSGKPSYQRIWQHAKNNPEFGNVRLVIFHKASSWNPWSKDSFEVIGKYSDEAAQTKLKKSIYSTFFFKGNGGIWDPQQNTIFGGTQNKNIGQIFTEYMKQPEQASKLSKFK
jgi:hypothetical protein